MSILSRDPTSGLGNGLFTSAPLQSFPGDGPSDAVKVDNRYDGVYGDMEDRQHANLASIGKNNPRPAATSGMGGYLFGNFND